MNSSPSPDIKPPDFSDHLLDFRIEIVRRASLVVMLITGLAAWMVMSLNPFPVWAFLILLVLMGLAALAHRFADDYPRPARYGLFISLLAGVLGLMSVNFEGWLPFVALPVILLSSILVERGEFIAGGCLLALTAGLTWLGWREYPLLAFAVALFLTVAIAWVVIFMLNTTLSWYQVTLDQSNRLLKETREHRGELSKALKNLTLANELQRRTERELIQARKSAEEARILKEKFAAKVSHELRTPLALIAGFSEVMYNSPEIYGDVTWTPTMRRDIAQVYHNSHHLLALVDDILNLSRFEMTGFTISLEEANLNDLLNETAEIAADLFRGPAVRFWTRLPPALPILRIDRTRIRQVILNLINNARRFTESGEVQLTAQVQDHEILIEVRDTGPGIAADKLDLIFQEFYQVEDSLLKNKGGTGLGLAICKHFVETHGGRIWAESELGRGSSFYFSLPLGGVYLGEETGGGAALAPAILARVLVLGGDDHVLAMLRSVSNGYEFLALENPEHLAAAVARYHPRAVVWNVLPGDEAQEMTLPEPLPVPLIRCSLPSALWLVKKFGLHACLSKPVTREILTRELERLPEARRILLVDDDPDFIQLVQRILQTIDPALAVSSAVGGQPGLLAARETHPDLILLDLTMPDLDGFAVIAELKRDMALQSTPILLLTAALTPERLMPFPANRLVVDRQGEMRLMETLNLVKAALGVLETEYAESTDEVMGKMV